MVITPLSGQQDRAAFDCGVDSLNQFLKRYARQNAERDLSRTFVAVSPDAARIAGYYTLTLGMVEFSVMPAEKLPHYPIPVALLGRLAVDRAFQGQRLGERLLFDALARAEEASQRMGLFAVVVDALDEGAYRFYAKYGFKQRADGALRLYMTMKTIRRMGLTVAPLHSGPQEP